MNTGNGRSTPEERPEAQESERPERNGKEPATASEQESPEPVRPVTEQERAEVSPDRLEDPPKAEGERDER